jgi:hypothetical protein
MRLSLPKKSRKSPNQLVAVPIKLRGEPLGVINLRFEASQVPQDTVDLLENTPTVLRLRLKNARLLRNYNNALSANVKSARSFQRCVLAPISTAFCEQPQKNLADLWAWLKFLFS